MLRHLGGVGVFILAALDSSVLATLGAVDALTIVLAARHPELWSYYAMCSTRSAGLQSLTACRILESSIDVLGERYSTESTFLHRFGSLSLSLAALLPPPFPTSAFVIGAGVTRYPFIAFVLSFGMGRMCRFALLAYLAPVFGRRFVTSCGRHTRWHLWRRLAVCWCVSGCWRGSSSGNLNRIRLSVCSSIWLLKTVAYTSSIRTATSNFE